MRTGDILKNLAVFSPVVIPFSGLPLFGVSGFHFTISRAYISLMFIAYLVHSLNRGALRLPSGRSGAIFWLLILYGALLALSFYWSEDMNRAIAYNLYYIWYVLFVGVFLVAGLSQKDLENFYDVWVVTGGIVALMCFFEVTYKIRFPGSRYLYEESLSHFWPTATFSNENNLAIYLAITGIFALAKTDHVKWVYSWLIWLSLLWVLYVIILTDSRGGFVVFALGVVLYQILKNKISAFKLVKGAGIIVLMVLIAGAIGLLEPAKETFDQVIAVAGEGDARISLLVNSLQAMQENHLMGVGAGGIEVYMSQFDNVRVKNVHNWLGEIIANTGLLGGVIWLVMLFLMLVYSISTKSSNHIYMISVFVVFLLFPLWQSIVSSMIQFSVFWLFLASYLVQFHNKSVRNK